MNTHHPDIEAMLKKLGAEPVPDDIHELAQTTKTAFVRELSPTKPIMVRRLIWRNRLVKCAAAAVIVGVAYWAMQFLGIEPDGTTPALAIGDVLAAMKKAECIHTVMRFEDGTDPNEDEVRKRLHAESHGTEYWDAINPSLSVYKSPDGHLTLGEYEIGRLTTYDPTTNTIVINDKSSIAQPGDYTSIAEKWLKRIDEQEGLGARVESMETTLENHPATLIKVSNCTLGAPNSVLMLYVDPHTRRPIKLYWTTLAPNGSKLWYLFDYPQTWPTDIYQAGAPRDAKIKDITPNREFSEILSEIQQSAEQNFGLLPESCIAIEVKSTDYARKYVPDGVTYVDVFHLHDGQCRQDRIRYISSEYINTENDKTEDFIAKSFDAQYPWWMTGPLEDYNWFKYRIEIANQHTGRHVTLERKKHTDQVWQTIDRRIADNKDLYTLKVAQSFPLAALGNSSTDIAFPVLAFPMGVSKKIIVDPYAQANNLICIERLERGYVYGPTGEVTLPRRTLYYLDPGKAFLCTRLVYIYKRDAEWHDDPDWLKDVSRSPRNSHYRMWQVLEYGRTQSGMWYVKEQAYDSGNFSDESGFHVDHPEDLAIKDPALTTVYLDETPEFSDGLFDPNTLGVRTSGL